MKIINTCLATLSLYIFLFFFISLIDSFFISDLKIKQEIKLQVLKIVKKVRFYAINKAIYITTYLWFIRVCLIKKKERK